MDQTTQKLHLGKVEAKHLKYFVARNKILEEMSRKDHNWKVLWKIERN